MSCLARGLLPGTGIGTRISTKFMRWKAVPLPLFPYLGSCLGRWVAGSVGTCPRQRSMQKYEWWWVGDTHGNFLPCTSILPGTGACMIKRILDLGCAGPGARRGGCVWELGWMARYGTGVLVWGVVMVVVTTLAFLPSFFLCLFFF